MTWPEQQFVDSPQDDRAGIGPRLVEFADQRDGVYLVRDLYDERTIRVAKPYAQAEPFPFSRGHTRRGALLLRLSTIALISAFLGGVGGLLLGALVVCSAVIQLGRFNGRVRRWKRRARLGRHDVQDLLPASASSERSRLLGALGQGMLAAFLGAGVCLLLLPHLLHYLPHLLLTDAFASYLPYAGNWWSCSC
jgi:hypothetical protein